jgi:hypothetical protein
MSQSGAGPNLSYIVFCLLFKGNGVLNKQAGKIIDNSAYPAGEMPQRDSALPLQNNPDSGIVP